MGFPASSHIGSQYRGRESSHVPLVDGVGNDHGLGAARHLCVADVETLFQPNAAVSWRLKIWLVKGKVWYLESECRGHQHGGSK